MSERVDAKLDELIAAFESEATSVGVASVSFGNTAFARACARANAAKQALRDYVLRGAADTRPTARESNYLRRVLKVIDAMTDDEIEEKCIMYFGGHVNIGDTRVFVEDIVTDAATRVYDAALATEADNG